MIGTRPRPTSVSRAPRVEHQSLAFEAVPRPLLRWCVGRGVGLLVGQRATVDNLPAMTAHLTIGDGDSALDERLSGELDAFNFAALGRDDLREFTVKVEDDGDLVAGLSGWTWGTCAGIGMVWVREGDRRDGWGGRLLSAAEEVARGRGCRQVLVSSFTFQAPDFYRRHGYVEFARSPDLPVEGAADVHLLKLI